MSLKLTAIDSGHDIIIERNFTASAELVFKVFSNPEYFKQWIFPETAAFEIEKFDCQTGGSYLTWHKGPNNIKYGFQGVFHEVKYAELIIQTSEFLGLPFKVIPTLEITKFESAGPELTKLTKHIICVNNDVRNAMLQNGMEEHFTGSFTRIDEMLKLNNHA
jgi:uncharacterized protein YndB with AHSA1/START domain